MHDEPSAFSKKKGCGLTERIAEGLTFSNPLSGPEKPPHEDRGQDGRGRGRRPLENRLYGVVFEPWLIGYVDEPFDDILADEIAYRGREYGHEPLLHRVVHAVLSAFYSLLWSVPTMGCAKTPQAALRALSGSPHVLSSLRSLM